MYDNDTSITQLKFIIYMYIDNKLCADNIINFIMPKLIRFVFTLSRKIVQLNT